MENNKKRGENVKKVKYSKLQDIELVFFIFIVSVYLGIALFAFEEYNQKYENYMKTQEEVFDNSIKDTLGAYEDFSNFIFKAGISSKSSNATLSAIFAIIVLLIFGDFFIFLILAVISFIASLVIGKKIVK